MAGAVFVVALFAACGDASPEPSPAPITDASTPGTSDTESVALSTPEGSSGLTFAFPTGPAVTVPDDYTPPGDRVDHTGAYLPANGKPTLVFVDAIW